jgi:hypothetical protein
VKEKRMLALIPERRVPELVQHGDTQRFEVDHLIIHGSQLARER